MHSTIQTFGITGVSMSKVPSKHEVYNLINDLRKIFHEDDSENSRLAMELRDIGIVEMVIFII